MVRVTDRAVIETRDDHDGDHAPFNFAGSAVLAALVGTALAWTARSGSLPLLVTVAVLQALLTFAWMLGLRVPGRIGGIVIAALASAASDVAVSVWPQQRLSPQLAVIGLVVLAMFVHQLMRGAARVRVLESLGGIALLVVAVTSLPSLLQIRHEFAVDRIGADPAFAVVVIGAAALVVGYFTDMVVAAPRFDTAVPRGLVAVLASAVVGAAVGQLTLRDSAQFPGARGVFIGASLGALVALLAVAVAFIEQQSRLPDAGFPRRARPLLSVLVPLSLLAPIALLLCLSVRT